MTLSVQRARSFLFVPGNRPERFVKASACGADQVILDLEDSVPVADKTRALAEVTRYLQDKPALVRVNPVSTHWHATELSALRQAQNLTGVVLPKADLAATSTVGAALRAGIVLLPLVESAAGVFAARSLATLPSVGRLLFGSLDLALDLGIDELSADEDALAPMRAEVVLASAAAGLPGPVDGVHVGLEDLAALAVATRRGRSLGFSGKLCIHPVQVPVVHAAFAPSAEQVARARRIVEAAERSGGAATTVDGAMVDEPEIRRAQLVLDRLAP